MSVHHRARTAGKSKYGMARIFKVLMDLLTVKFMIHYLTKPLYFFGKVGALTLLLAFAVLSLVCVQKVYQGTDMSGNPLLYLSVTFAIISAQVMLMGLMMEILTRTYHESQGRRPYAIRAVHGREPEDGAEVHRPSASSTRVQNRSHPGGRPPTNSAT
jgi:hypothetical protein